MIAALALLATLSMQAPSLTPVVLNKPPEWNGWSGFDQSVESMNTALGTLEPKFGRLDGSSYQCLFAKMGVAMTAYMRTKLIVQPTSGAGPSPLQGLNNKISELERYFQEEERRWCAGGPGTRATEAIRLLNLHGYTPTALTRVGGKWDHIGERPIFRLPENAPVTTVVTAATVLALTMIFMPELAPALVVGVATK